MCFFLLIFLTACQSEKSPILDDSSVDELENISPVYNLVDNINSARIPDQYKVFQYETFKITGSNGPEVLSEKYVFKIDSEEIKNFNYSNDSNLVPYTISHIKELIINNKHEQMKDRFYNESTEKSDEKLCYHYTSSQMSSPMIVCFKNNIIHSVYITKWRHKYNTFINWSIIDD